MQQEAANLLLGTVIIFALITLSALILLRGKRRRNTNLQIDRRDTFQPGAEPTTERKGKFDFLGKIFGIFRRKKTDIAQEAVGPQLTETLEALEAISDIETSGDEERSKFPELTRGDADEELTEAEAEAFRALTNPGESEEGTAARDDPSEDSVESTHGIFGGRDDSLLGAFKAATVVDEVREALLARVGAVELKDLAEEISSLTARVKVYVPENPDS